MLSSDGDNIGERLIAGVDWWGRDPENGDWTLARMVNPALIHLYPQGSIRWVRNDETGAIYSIVYDKAVKYTGQVGIYLN